MLIIAPCQEAKNKNLGHLFQALDNYGMLSVLIRIASMRRF